MVYEVPVATAEALESKASSHLQSWLGIPKSLNNIALYGSGNKLRLPFKFLEEEFKVLRSGEVLEYKSQRTQTGPEQGFS